MVYGLYLFPITQAITAQKDEVSLSFFSLSLYLSTSVKSIALVEWILFRMCTRAVPHYNRVMRHSLHSAEVWHARVE